MLGTWMVAMALALPVVGQPTRPAEVTPTGETQPAEVESLLPPSAPPGARPIEGGWIKLPQPQRELAGPPEAPALAYVIPVREPITVKTYEAIRRKYEQNVRGRADVDLVILDMDTFGGRVDAALNISRLLKSDMDQVWTVCYVRTRAISAGALIALACDQIVMTPVGKIGDSAPISMGGQLEGVRREKIETVLRTEFGESAERNGYSVELAKSMVSYDLEVWKIRHKQTREVRFVFADEWKSRVTHATETITRSRPQRPTPPANPLRDLTPGAPGQERRQPDPNDTRKETVTVARPAGAADARNPNAAWELIDVAVGEGKLLTMNPRQAKENGFVTDILAAGDENPYAELAELLSLQADPIVLEDNWSEALVAFLTSSPVLGFLFFLGLLCAYVEINTPGFGAAGAAAIACFAVIFGSHYLVGLANWWEIALFAVGIVLIAVEIFITPGFGVIGGAGVLCCMIGLMAILIENTPGRLPMPADVDWGRVQADMLALVLGFLASIVAAALLAKYFQRIPIANQLILSQAETGTIAPYAQGSPIDAIQVGRVGTTESTLRPAGKVWFDEDLIDAVTEGDMIEPGTPVRVLRRQGNRVVVERADV